MGAIADDRTVGPDMAMGCDYCCGADKPGFDQTEGLGTNAALFCELLYDYFIIVKAHRLGLRVRTAAVLVWNERKVKPPQAPCTVLDKREVIRTLSLNETKKKATLQHLTKRYCVDSSESC